MRGIGRSILAVLAGVLAGGIIIGGIESLSSVIFPLPRGMTGYDIDIETLRALGVNTPIGAFAMVLLAWVAGTLVGAWLAGTLAGRVPIAHGLVIGLIFLAGGVANMLQIPHPRWMWAVGIPIFPVFGYLGGRLARKES